MASHSLVSSTVALLFLGLSACQSQEASEPSHFDEVYSLPNTDQDVPQNMRFMSPSELDKGGILKCDGLDSQKKYVYARFEMVDHKVQFSYVGSISGKYQIFHDVLMGRIKSAKLDFKGNKGEIDFYEQGSKAAFLSLNLDIQSSNPLNKETAAKLSYENKEHQVDYQKIELDCVAFRHIEG